ncbi:auxin transport protein BIG [Tanacetum coccineum]
MQSLLQFILEQLCNLICLSEPEVVYHLILNKAHTQEEFIRGLMTKNPYSSGEIGPLIRDVKNKICNQLDLLGLIKDDCGDLSIAQVYEQVWKKSSNQSTNAVAATLLSSNVATSARDSPPMTVTYRLQNWMRIEKKAQDPEVEFAIANAVRKYIRLETLSEIHLRDDLKLNQEQLVVVLNLLMLCWKIRENKRALLRLRALTNESNNINIAHNALTVSNEEAGVGEQAKKIVLIRPQKVKQIAEKHRDGF